MLNFFWGQLHLSQMVIRRSCTIFKEQIFGGKMSIKILNCKFFQSGSLPLWRPPPAALWADPNLLPRRGGMASTGPGQHRRGSLQGRQRKNRGDDMLLSSTLAGKTYRSSHKLNLFLSGIIFRQMAMQLKTKSINRCCNKMCKCIYLQILSQGTKPLCFYLGRALFLPLNGQKMPCILNHLAVIYLILQKKFQKMWTAVSFKTLQFRNSTLWNFKRIRNLTWRGILIWLGYNVSGFWIFCKYFCHFASKWAIMQGPRKS